MRPWVRAVPGSWLLLLLASAASAAPVTFAAIGDFGSDNLSTRQVARLVKSWQPHFIITLGDNNYPAGAAQTIDRNVGQFYHEFIFPYLGRYGAGAVSNRFFPCLGNHDWMATNAQPYLDYFSLPGNERYYTFLRGPVQLFCLDSDKHEPDGWTADSTQGHWLQQQLSQSRAIWKIVYLHHAPYSTGILHGSHTGETAHMRWPFHSWGADAVLGGHDHIYERVHTNGLVFFVNGLGGDSKDKLSFLPVPGSAKRYSDDFGALRIDAGESYLLFRFFNWRGSQIDSYRLVPRPRENELPGNHGQTWPEKLVNQPPPTTPKPMGWLIGLAVLLITLGVLVGLVGIAIVARHKQKYRIHDPMEPRPTNSIRATLPFPSSDFFGAPLPISRIAPP